MRILGHGIDLVDTARVERLLAAHGERFVARCYTDRERRYCEQGGRHRLEHYAARFAAKEAVLKALGTGWSGGIAWTDVEVVREPSGRPSVLLVGEAQRIAAELGVRAWHLSLSHLASHALASAIAEGGDAAAD